MGRPLTDTIAVRELYTTEEVARLFGVSRPSVHQWARAGKLAFTKTPGGHRRIHHDEVLRFAAATGREVPAQLHTVPKLVVVTDDAAARGALRQVLAVHFKQGLDVVAAGDGFVSFVHAVSTHADVVVIDAVLRGLDGVHACRVLKSQAATKAMRVIGVATSKAVESAFEAAGADAVVRKPVEARAVAKAVEGLVAVEAGGDGRRRGAGAA